MYRLPNPLTEDSVRKLMLDPRYQDAHHPEHRGFTDFVTSAFQALYPEPEKRFIRIGPRTAEPDTIVPDLPAEQLGQWSRLAAQKTAAEDDQAERQSQDVAGARAKMTARMHDAQDDAIRRAGRGLSASGSLGFDPEAAKDSDKPMGGEMAADRMKNLETMGLKNVPPLPHVWKSLSDAAEALHTNPNDPEARQSYRQAFDHLDHYVENLLLPLDLIGAAKTTHALSAIASPIAATAAFGARTNRHSGFLIS